MHAPGWVVRRALVLTLSLGSLSLSGCPGAVTAPASCDSSRECTAAGLVCDTAAHTCVECLADPDCLSADRICTAHQCVAITHCTSSRECPGLVCSPALGRCVECLTDTDCPGGGACVSSACVAPGVDAGPSSDAGMRDTGPGRDAGADAWVEPPPYTGQLDILLLVDNSNSMTEEQASLVSALPRFVTQITTGDTNLDGTPDFPAPSSLHIGIIDTDMGLGSISGITSCHPGLGDDGLMQTQARFPPGGCASDYTATYPDHVFDFDSGGAVTPGMFARDVGCVATLGTNGCGFEMSLEASLKAISLDPGRGSASWTRPGYVPPVFTASTYGHGNDPATNGGFLRPASVLGIVLVTDEDDCSTMNYEIFSRTDSTDLNLRCHTYASQLTPISRYAEGFLGLRASAGQLAYAVVGGVPPEVAGNPPDQILAHPNMVEQIDPVTPSRILPACVSPGGRGVAYPAIRLTRVASELDQVGARVSVQSICNTDYGGAFDAIGAMLGDAIGSQP